MPPALTPGAYLRLRRTAAGLTLDDLALMTDTVPPVGARARAEWLGAIETGAHRLGTDVALALAGAAAADDFPFDPRVLAKLVAIENGADLPPPQVCAGCGCSWFDPCVDGEGAGCGWATIDRCTACPPARSASAAA